VPIAGSAGDFAVHLRAFARAEGHGFAETPADQRLAGPRAPSGALVVAIDIPWRLPGGLNGQTTGATAGAGRVRSAL
jgi:hypothetical protein